MPRLRFQTRDIIYEVHTVFEFENVGRRRQKTYYSDVHGFSKSEVLEVARANAEMKLEASAGELLSIEITKIYK